MEKALGSQFRSLTISGSLGTPVQYFPITDGNTKGRYGKEIFPRSYGQEETKLKLKVRRFLWIR